MHKMIKLLKRYHFVAATVHKKVKKKRNCEKHDSNEFSAGRFCTQLHNFNYRISWTIEWYKMNGVFVAVEFILQWV